MGKSRPAGRISTTEHNLLSCLYLQNTYLLIMFEPFGAYPVVVRDEIGITSPLLPPRYPRKTVPNWQRILLRTLLHVPNRLIHIVVEQGNQYVPRSRLPQDRPHRPSPN